VPLKPAGNLIARFFERAMPTGQIDEATGLPQYRKVEFISLLIPGDRNTEVHKRVTPAIARQFKGEYEAFKAGVEYQGDGVPLAKLAGILLPIEQVEGLREIRVFTVEQLAGLSDSQCMNRMGMRALRQKAIDYIESAKSAAPMAKLRDENEALRNRMALLETQIAELASAHKDHGTTDGALRRGRPPKNTQTEGE